MIENGSKGSYSLIPNQRILGIALVASMLYGDDLVYEYLLNSMNRYGFQMSHRMVKNMKDYAKNIFQTSENEIEMIEARLSLFLK